MSTFVSASWVHDKLDSGDYLILDTRRPMKYLQGHPRDAVNLSASHAFDQSGALKSVADLEQWIGGVGLDASRHPVLYDNSDGRNAGLVAWVLEYLGRNDVYVMETFFETSWVSAGYELFYRPVEPKPAKFEARVNPALRAFKADAASPDASKLVDFRSDKEFEEGHIPGAVHLSWKDLVSGTGPLRAAELRAKLESAGIAPKDSVIAYCQSGLRASLGYLLLADTGMNVRLYDGSYNDWSK